MASYTLPRKTSLLAVLLLLTACEDEHPHYVAQTLSDARADGDLTFDPVTSTFTITQALGIGRVTFGIDSSRASLPESRAFLDFPLDGAAGGDLLPLDAKIIEADVEVFVDAVAFAATVPTVLDLVPFGIPLLTSDFDTSPLTSSSYRTLSFFSSDAGSFVQIDVTDLLVEAQAQALRNFQLRFSLDAAASAGLVQLADSEARTAPLLTVEFE